MEKCPGMIVGQSVASGEAVVDLRGKLGEEGKIFCREFMDDVCYTWMVFIRCNVDILFVGPWNFCGGLAALYVS